LPQPLLLCPRLVHGAALEELEIFGLVEAPVDVLEPVLEPVPVLLWLFGLVLPDNAAARACAFVLALLEFPLVGFAASKLSKGSMYEAIAPAAITIIIICLCFPIVSLYDKSLPL
jgi:hypothetical protein